MPAPLRTLAVCLFTACSSPPAAAPPAPKYGPAEAPRASPLSSDSAYLRLADAPDFWALIPYYVPQFNGAACSAASVAMVVNAAVRANRPLSNDEPIVTQEVLLERVQVEHWKARLSLLGYWLHHGLSLRQLGAVTEASLRAFGAQDVAVQAMTANGSDAGLARFRSALTENEASNRDLMLVHFLQDEVTAAPGGPYPHISPIGAWDSERRRLLVLDVDREWYEPYWVSDEVLWKAMSHTTDAFGAGGFVRASFRR